MIGQNVNIPVDGATMDAYVARPQEGSGPHPAVVVLQEVFGVNAEMRRVADLLASAGYAALAINYYHRTHPNLDVPYDDEGMKIGIEAASHISRATMRADLAASASWLNAQPFVKAGKLATWGFCMGGSVAFFSATMPEFCGAVCFYGGSIARPYRNGEAEGLADAAALRAPVLLCFGEADAGIPMDAVQRIERELRAREKTFTLQVYPGVGHAFFRHGSQRAIADQRDFSDEALAHAVADSWNLVQKFLRECFSRS